MTAAVVRSRFRAAAALLFLGLSGDGLPNLVHVASPPGGARQPSVAVDARGGVHVAYVEGERVVVVTCPAGAKSFGEPHVIAAVPGMACGLRRGPRLVACEGVLVASWIAPPPGALDKAKPPGPDLFACRSTDGGATWSPTARVNKDAGVCGEGLHALAAGPGKTVYAAWNQPFKREKPGMGTRFARSADAGATWADETWVYDPPSGTVCECCHPSVAAAPSGKVAVMFRNSLKGARDMYCVESSDSGKTWGEAWKLGTGTWELPACPMDGGGLAYLTDGTLFAAWRRKNQVYESRGQSEERSQGEGTQPWVGGVPGGKCWTAWEDSEGGVATRCQADSVSVAFKIGAKCSDPVVDGSASGTVFCAWEVVHKDGTPPAVYGAFLARPVAPK